MSESLETHTVPDLNEEEQNAMDRLLSVMQTITGDWGMTANGGELGAAVHVLQGFIIQHMLHRLAPDIWSGWGQEQAVRPRPTEGPRPVRPSPMQGETRP